MIMYIKFESVMDFTYNDYILRRKYCMIWNFCNHKTMYCFVNIDSLVTLSIMLLAAIAFIEE